MTHATQPTNPRNQMTITTHQILAAKQELMKVRATVRRLVYYNSTEELTNDTINGLEDAVNSMDAAVKELDTAFHDDFIHICIEDAVGDLSVMDKQELAEFAKVVEERHGVKAATFKKCLKGQLALAESCDGDELDAWTATLAMYKISAAEAARMQYISSKRTEA